MLYYVSYYFPANWNISAKFCKLQVKSHYTHAVKGVSPRMQKITLLVLVLFIDR